MTVSSSSRSSSSSGSASSSSSAMSVRSARSALEDSFGRNWSFKCVREIWDGKQASVLGELTVAGTTQQCWGSANVSTEGYHALAAAQSMAFEAAAEMVVSDPLGRLQGHSKSETSARSTRRRPQGINNARNSNAAAKTHEERPSPRESAKTNRRQSLLSASSSSQSLCSFVPETPRSLSRSGSRGSKRDILQNTGPRILIVEDEPINIKVLSDGLSKHNFRVKACVDGMEAVELITLRGQEYDLILMDLKMKVMDGQDAALRIREWETEDGRQHTPILAVTASVLREDQDLCFKNGMQGWVSKPIRLNTLVDTINNFLDKSQVTFAELMTDLRERPYEKRMEEKWTAKKFGDLNLFKPEPISAFHSYQQGTIGISTAVTKMMPVSHDDELTDTEDGHWRHEIRAVRA